MRRNLILITLTTVLGLTSALDASAARRGAYSMEILVDGIPLGEHRARGRTYVEALENAEYSIRLTNDTGRRVAVTLSVDGLNTIDAKHTSAREGRKWILDPHRSIVLDGWQTGTSTARRFFFTTEERSYGAWLGDTTNLGVVSAAFFRERRPAPSPYAEEESRLRQRKSPSAPPAPGRAGADAGRRDAAAEETEPRRRDAAGEIPDEMAATGIGRELRHRVRRIEFDAERRPAALIEIRYEYRDALARLGVLPPLRDPLARREGARGFEDDGFAPDPYRR